MSDAPRGHGSAAPRREKLAILPSARERRGRLSGRSITLCVTGSIAAYKSVLALRLLQREGARLEVVLSPSAERFVGAATFSGLTGRPVYHEMFDPDVGGELHIDLAARSDLVLIAPATADLIARMAEGRADDLVAAIALCAKCPVLVVPAMHPSMWEHPATRRNIERLVRDARVRLIGPVVGAVASGEVGEGRMAEPEQIVTRIVSELASGALKGRHIVVTAGPTAEDIDPVRFLSNRSSGKMGFALAERAALRGARVTLITGPVSLTTPYEVHRIDVRSATAMRSALWQTLHPTLSNADALIMAAAVADYRPVETHASKLKRNSSQTLTLELKANVDILAEVGRARAGRRPVLVGFALETDSDEQTVASARVKREEKRVDLMVANRADDVLGRDDNRATLISSIGAEVLGELPKLELSDRIIDWIARRFEEGSA